MSSLFGSRSRFHSDKSWCCFITTLFILSVLCVVAFYQKINVDLFWNGSTLRRSPGGFYSRNFPIQNQSERKIRIYIEKKIDDSPYFPEDSNQVKQILRKKKPVIKTPVKTYKCHCEKPEKKRFIFPSWMYVYERDYRYVSALAFPHPSEEGSSNKDVLLRRHPNLGELTLVNMTRCDLIPSMTSFNWDGVWQITEQMNKKREMFYLMSVSCDRDEKGLCTVARVLVLSTSREPTKMACYLWSDVAQKPIVSLSDAPLALDDRFGKLKLQAYIVNCRTPQPMKIIAVSLSKYSCYLVNNFLEISAIETQAVEDLKHSKQSDNSVARQPTLFDLAVCGPALLYTDDKSKQLVEWLEILKAIDVKRVVLYRVYVHPNVDKVLRHYEKEGFVQVMDFNFPTPYNMDGIFLRAWVKRASGEYWATEAVYHTDCLLRQRLNFRYILSLNLDELPVLGQFKSVTSLLKYYNNWLNNEPTNIKLQRRAFHVDLPPGQLVKKTPKGFFYLRLNYCERLCNHNDCGLYKTIVDTRQTIAVNSYGALQCIDDCNVFRASQAEHIYAAHYSGKFYYGISWPELLWEENYFVDKIDEIVPAVQKVWKKLRI